MYSFHVSENNLVLKFHLQVIQKLATDHIWLTSGLVQSPNYRIGIVHAWRDRGLPKVKVS